jgi:uncharacterized membrane-anchored protein YhcB (DUF1043 family)
MQPKNNIREQLNWYQKTVCEKPTAQQTSELINRLKNDYEHVYKLYQERKKRTQHTDSVKTASATTMPILNTHSNSHVNTTTTTSNPYSTGLPCNIPLESR